MNISKTQNLNYTYHNIVLGQHQIQLDNWNINIKEFNNTIYEIILILTSNIYIHTKGLTPYKITNIKIEDLKFVVDLLNFINDNKLVLLKYDAETNKDTSQA